MHFSYGYMAGLLLKEMAGELTAEEVVHLQQWRAAITDTENALKLTDFSYLQERRKEYAQAIHKAAAMQFLLPEEPGADMSVNSSEDTVTVPAGVHSIRRSIWVAASVILLSGIGLALYFYLNKGIETLPPVIVQTNGPDITAPETNRATVTLANGQTVYLDSAANGALVLQGGVQLVKLADGRIAYQNAEGQFINELQYNTLSNPRGSTVINMQLADGTHVWLNAGSSITYPVAFTGNQRYVELKGEGYFEVAKDPAKKFIVTANGTATEVLGTRFNVNAYDDEPETKITLLEGSVKVSREKRHSEPDSESVIQGTPSVRQGTSDQVRNAHKSIMLQPGQQAAIHRSSFIIHHSIDTEQVMAWKNGLFNFNGIGFEAVMKQLERWYDIEVVYEKGVPAMELAGEMTRDVTLQGMLNGLKLLGVKYRVTGTKVSILP